MISLNPKVDKFINFIKEKISIKVLQTFVSICILFMFLDCVATAFGLSYFTIRVIEENNIKVKNQEYIDKAYEKIYTNEWKVNLINRFLNNEKMLKTFPRLTVKDIDGNIIYVRELYPEIQTYYYKFGKNNYEKNPRFQNRKARVFLIYKSDKGLLSTEFLTCLLLTCV